MKTKVFEVYTVNNNVIDNQQHIITDDETIVNDIVANLLLVAGMQEGDKYTVCVRCVASKSVLVELEEKDDGTDA